MQLRQCTLQQTVTVAAVLQTLGFPEIWGCHSNADVNSRLLGYDSIYIVQNRIISEKRTALVCYVWKATEQLIYTYLSWL